MKDGSSSSQNSELSVNSQVSECSENSQASKVTAWTSQKRYPHSKNSVIGRQMDAIVDALAAINERLTLIERRQIMLFAGRGGDLEGREFGSASSENRGVDGRGENSGRRVENAGRGKDRAAENDCRGARGFIGLDKRIAERRDLNRDDKKDFLRQMIADFCKVNSTSWKKGTANKWSGFLARVADIYAAAGDFNGDFFEAFKAKLETFKHGTRVLYWGRLRLFLEFLVEYHEFDKKILRFIPKPRSVGGEIGGDKGVLTHEMVEKIAAVTDNEELKDYLTLAVNTGMRSGEILALRAEDVKEIDGEFYASIKKTARAAGDGGLDGGCKTASSHREIQLNSAAAAVVLKRAKKGGFLFATRGGDYHTSTSFLHDDFKKACEICGFSPRLRLYNARAGYVSDTIDGATDEESFNRKVKEAAKNCGHASVATTMSSYNKIA